MTDLRRPVSRRVELPRGPVVVTLHPRDTIGFRQLRRRVEYKLPLAKVFVMAADAYQQQLKAERKAARKAARA